MALSANMAGASAGGTAMTMNSGMAFGGSAMATPTTFSSSFSGAGGARHAPGPGGDSCCGGGGGGGAYDLKSWEKQEEPDEDTHACLGVDVGTSSIKVSLLFLFVVYYIPGTYHTYFGIYDTERCVYLLL